MHETEVTRGNPRELADRLYRAAETVVLGAGLYFGEGASMDLQQRAEFGANDIISRTNGDIGSPEANRLVAEAEANIVLFVETMIEARPIVYAPERLAVENIVGEDTFAWAHSRVCPLWPIC